MSNPVLLNLSKGFSHLLIIFFIAGLSVTGLVLFKADRKESKKIEIERYALIFPKDATNPNLNVSIRSLPNVKISEQLRSLFFTLEVTAQGQEGNKVTTLSKPFEVLIDFANWDLMPYKKGSLSIYSSEDNVNWSKENTKVDFDKKIASTFAKRLGFFALIAERADTIAPTTAAILNGRQRQVSLNVQDNTGGLGVDYTLYKLAGSDWRVYKEPLTFINKGHYKIEFFSADKDENIEEVKADEFDIN